MNTNETKTLNLLKKGEKARVKKIHAKGKLLHKLLDMGFVNRVEIEVIREAPLYDPMQLKLHNYHLSVRKSEAMLVEIEDCK
ncbi:ferrous iron transport protein A [Halarcobacter ebronensis]|uniref:Ferrous iron transport protein A n=1 Tax=Halarcobacter ebronensis TaxID=1462615 RepID=A0A4Q0YBE5_9BACT|nr:FeoA family protein [Halarcobacter ebronensis]QKF81297.1 ferrous iron transport protein A [Halarcobacter ebronensis]RXJ67656.1 ferrous iron transport protein A [Halarcobacter ebronensis]RXK04862.1 ferrous iron transport protein A [Halarcobacter ebronensis]